MRLIDQLVAMGLSKSGARKALSGGKVFVSGVPTALPVREVDPEQVQVRSNAPRLRPGLDLVILHRAEGYLVIWKPPGLLSVPAPGRRDDPSVLSWVHEHRGQALAVHRLDEGTSGLMLVALTEPAQLHLKDELEQRRISRRYRAIVHPPVARGWERSVENMLVRDRGDGRRGSGTGPGAKRAVTHLRELERIGHAYSLVEARLETGRTHQIRIHLSEAGHPVVGDSLYGARKQAPMRLALHAYALSFVDPDGKEMSFEVPLPDDMESFVRRGGAAPDTGRPPSGPRGGSGGKRRRRR